MQPNSSDGEPDPQSESQPQPESQASEPQEQQDKWFWEHTLYQELRKLAAAKMAQEDPDQTLQATALVHEAYIRLVDQNGAREWGSRDHFFAAAAEAMRRILVEQARRKGGLAAGGQHRRVELSQVDPEIQRPGLNVLALSDALDKFAVVDPRAAEIVKLRFFAGLTRQQAAEVLGVSISTVDTDWTYAKCWLQLELTRTTSSQPTD